MKPVILRLAGFTGLPLLSVVTPFLLLPVLSRIAGEGGWSSILTGQAVGAFGATALVWGWNTVGPVQVAQNPDARFRAELYRESLRTRLAMCVLVFPVVSLLAWVLAAPGIRLEAAAMSWTSLVAGLSPAWFCIGVGKPTLLAAFDTIPKVVATLAATPIILITREIWLYAVILLAAVIVSLVAFQRVVVPQGRATFTNWEGTLCTIRHQMGPAAISLSGNTYAATPVPVAQTFLPSVSAAGFGSADAVYRLGLFTVIALGNTFQGWTLEVESCHAKRRQILAIGAHVALGVSGAAFLALLGPLATEILYGAPVRASTGTCLFFGISFLFISASSPFMRNLLIPFGGQRLILVWTVVSAVFGLSWMVFAGYSGWTDGIAMGMAISEGILFLAVLWPGLRRLRNL